MSSYTRFTQNRSQNWIGEWRIWSTIECNWGKCKIKWIIYLSTRNKIKTENNVKKIVRNTKGSIISNFIHFHWLLISILLFLIQLRDVKRTLGVTCVCCATEQILKTKIGGYYFENSKSRWTWNVKECHLSNNLVVSWKLHEMYSSLEFVLKHSSIRCYMKV